MAEKKSKTPLEAAMLLESGLREHQKREAEENAAWARFSDRHESLPLPRPLDLRRAFVEGYKAGRIDENAEWESSDPGFEE